MVKTAPERQYQRASCACPGRFQADGQAARKVKIITLSIGGVFIADPRPAAAGQDGKLEFLLEARRIRGRGRVVWNSRDNPDYRNGTKRRAGFALAFDDLAPADREAIDRYVRHRTRAFRVLALELEREDPDPALIRAIFRQLCPAESSHIRHIRKIVREEMRHFRLRK